MTDKELIKQEIERLLELLPVMDGDNVSINYAERICTALETYIDSLPEESTDEANCIRKSDDLEEEIDNYIKDNFFGSGSMGFFSNRTKQELNSIDVANIAHHFAEWQKDKMNLLLQTEYEKGLFDMREEIMKNTVLETEVLMDCDGDGIETPYEEWLTLEDTEIRCVPDGFKDGDIVKVILVKEDLL